MPHLTELGAIRARLERDTAWAAFSLADLEPVHRPHASWFGPAEGSAVVLVYAAYDPPIVFCQGSVAEVDALLGEPDVVRLTARAYLNVMPALLHVTGRHFSVFEGRSMVRMRLEPERFQPHDSAPVERLGPEHLDEVRALYADDPPAFFLPSQLRDGVYFGRRERGMLVAVAGTHVVSAAYAVGAIGNVYTRPDCRGRGYASEVTAAVAVELRRLGAATIVLNIVAANVQARRVYERIGFREYCVYYEGVATR